MSWHKGTDNKPLEWTGHHRFPARALQPLPATPGQRYPSEVELPDGYAVSGVVLSDQLKSLNWRTRKAKLIERVSSDVVAMVISLSLIHI